MANRGYYMGAYMGVGEPTPERVLHASVYDDLEYGVSYPLRISHFSTKSALTDFGVGMEFEIEDAYNDKYLIATIEAVNRGFGSNTQGDIIFKTLYEESLDERVSILADGTLKLNTCHNINGAQCTLLVRDNNYLIKHITVEDLADILGDEMPHGVSTNYIPRATSSTAWGNTCLTYDGTLLTLAANPTNFRLSNTDIAHYSTSFIYATVMPDIWHNVVAFGQWWPWPTFERYNGSSWSSATLNKNIFIEKTSASQTIIDGTTYTACRWTWYGDGKVNWSDIGAIQLIAAYVSPAPNINLTISKSNNGVDWENIYTKTGYTLYDSVNQILSTLLAPGNNAYYRVTIEVNNSRPLILVSLRVLTMRHGSQGGGMETQWPIAWDADRKIGIGTVAPDRQLTVVVDDAITNAVTTAASFAHTTTGSASSGIGVGVEFKAENYYNTVVSLARLEAINTDATGGYDKGDLVFKTYYSDEYGDNYNERMRIRADGLVIMQDDLVVGGDLDVYSEIRAQNISSNSGTALVLDSNGYIAKQTSSVRYKENIKPFDPDAFRLHQLRFCEFAWKDTKRRDWGLIAEEVAEVIPEAVTYSSNGQIEGLDLQKLILLAIKEIQNLRKKIESL